MGEGFSYVGGIRDMGEENADRAKGFLLGIELLRCSSGAEYSCRCCHGTNILVVRIWKGRPVRWGAFHSGGRCVQDISKVQR
jgi:hypothetical protein